MATSVMWFRRDLRLSDNPALVEAVADAGRGEGVVALFCLDDRLVRSSGAPREVFLYRCLRALDESIGGKLVVCRGDPAEVVPAIAAEAGAERVHAAADFSPYGSTRDDLVERKLADADVELRLVGSPYAVAPGTVLTTAGEPYKVFTPFLRAWRAVGWDAPLRAPAAVRWAEVAESVGIPKEPACDATLPVAGEPAAKRAARRFRDRTLDDYDRLRNMPGADATSRLSPHLKFGTIHPRQLLAKLGELEGPWHVPHGAVLAGVLRRRAVCPTRHGLAEPSAGDAGNAGRRGRRRR